MSFKKFNALNSYNGYYVGEKIKSEFLNYVCFQDAYL